MKVGAKSGKDFSRQEQQSHPVEGAQETPRASLAKYEFVFDSRKSPLMCWELQGSRTTKTCTVPTFNAQVF